MSEVAELVLALETSIADVVAALEKLSANERHEASQQAFLAIETGLADIAVALEQQIDLSPVVEAIRSLKLEAPAVTVAPQINVHPTPVTIAPAQVTLEAVIPPAATPVVHIMPSTEAGATWEVRIPGQYGAPGRVMTIVRTK